jgi:hypothetical protein
MKIETLKCGDCRYWCGGECRRFPPQMALWPNDNQHPVIYMPMSTYPGRGATDAGCGEFKSANPQPAREIPYNPAWTHGEIGADEQALMEANGWRMRPDGSYFKPGS